jgi:flagellar hook-length control protein FliK
MILMDGAGFLRVDGFKTSSGAYDVSFSFADRPSYSAARSYDTANGYTSSSSLRRAATLSDMATCAKSANGTAKAANGADCAARFVLSYHFFANLNTEYTQTNITNTALWVQNQVTIARQYVTNQFPSQFAEFTGYQGGTFGRLILNGL